MKKSDTRVIPCVFGHCHCQAMAMWILMDRVMDLDGSRAEHLPFGRTNLAVVGPIS